MAEPIRNLLLALVLGAVVSQHVSAAKVAARTAPAPLRVEAVNDGNTIRPFKRGTPNREALLRAQILLDRAHFSTGEIDAASGSNLKRALAAFQRQNELQPQGALDAETWALLNRDTAAALIEYTISAADVAGPFIVIPSDMAGKAKLPAMAYTSAIEAFGERFHSSPKLLRLLNPGKDLGREGETIIVPNVEQTTPLPKAARIVVSKSASTISLLDASGKLIAHFPASTGSAHDPLPVGTWKINGVARNPPFHYNPDLFWDAKAGDKKAKIPPGPNNPVGVVWIDLSKAHYGIHGSPEPAMIGKTQSHGCIRMTNWDAAALAQAVSPGMPAILQE
ncbi:MAG: L,D-transpeptidase [Betaproteobacteria bacterium]